MYTTRTYITTLVYTKGPSSTQ